MAALVLRAKASSRPTPGDREGGAPLQPAGPLKPLPQALPHGEACAPRLHPTGIGRCFRSNFSPLPSQFSLTWRAWF